MIKDLDHEPASDLNSERAKRPVLPNHIKEYVDSIGNEEKFLELFEAKDDNVDLRTDLELPEIIVLNKLRTFIIFLKERDLDTMYTQFFTSYLRLKISNERKSRGEFVDIHRKERFEQNLKRYGDFKTLFESKS